MCIEVLDALKKGEFGKLSENVIEDYKTKCHSRFPLCIAFVDQPPLPAPTNNDIDSTDNCTIGECNLPNGDASP